MFQAARERSGCTPSVTAEEEREKEEVERDWESHRGRLNININLHFIHSSALIKCEPGLRLEFADNIIISPCMCVVCLFVSLLSLSL